MSRTNTGRSLKTARAVLQVLRLMASRPSGVRTDEVAEFLAKSHATASYLLNSLCAEGYAQRESDGRYRVCEEQDLPGVGLRAPAVPPGVSASAVTAAGQRREPPHCSPGPPPRAPGRGGGSRPLTEAVDELFHRTGQRSYLATTQDRAVVVQEARGHKGLPSIPGLRPVVWGEAHCLALGKVLLAFAGPDALAAYRDGFGLTRYTPATQTDAEGFEAELARVRSVGYAVDREEFAAGFCCFSAPLRSASGGVLGALGLSVTTERFAAHGPALLDVLTEVAATVAGKSMTPRGQAVPAA